MKNVEKERFNEKMADFVWTYIVLALTPTQRRIITSVIMQTEIPKAKSKEFKPVINTKKYLAQTLNIFGSEGKVRKDKKQEIEEMKNMEVLTHIDDIEVKFSLLEAVEYSKKEVAFILCPSILPYFRYIKEMYDKYNLQYFVFSKSKNAPMLYLLMQKNGLVEDMSCSIKWLKHCLYIDDNMYAREYSFYEDFIVPAINDINKFSLYHIECSYFMGTVSFKVRLKTKQEMLFTPDVVGKQHFNGGFIMIEQPL